MTALTTDKYSAGEQGLGYIYQARLALLHLLQLPEDTTVFLEKDDDLDFIDGDGGKALASLKHKAVGDRLTDLSTDFWKSVNIWLARYKRDGRAASNLRFFLFTTGTVSTDSFLTRLLPDQPLASGDVATLTEIANAALAESKSKLIAPIATAFNELSDPEKQDFLERILILDGSPRIGDRGGPICLDRMLPFLSGASQCSAYAAGRRTGRWSKYTPSGVWPSSARCGLVWL
jgi:hypothetical protein